MKSPVLSLATGVALASTSFCAVSAWATTNDDELPEVFNEETGYVVQQFSEDTKTPATTAFNTNWYSAAKSQYVWKESAPLPHAGAKYYTTKTIVAPYVSGIATNWVFGGSQLVLGDGASFVPMSTNDNHPVITNLFMLGGAKFLWYNPKSAFEGACHIRRCSGNKPVYLSSSQTMTQNFDMDVDGDDNQSIVIRATINNSTARSTTFNLRGDWSKYSGSILVTNCCFSLGADSYTRLYVTGPSFPSLVTVTTNCTFGFVDDSGSLAVRSLTLVTRKPVVIPAGTTLTVGDLTLDEPSTFIFKDDASRLVITNALVNNSGSPLVLARESGNFDRTNDHDLPLLTLPPGSTLAEGDVQFCVNGLDGDCQSYETEAVTDPETGRVVVHVKAYKQISFNNIATTTARSPLKFADTAAGAFYWCDELTPHNKADYYSKYASKDFLLPDDAGIFTFAGESLTFGDKSNVGNAASGPDGVFIKRIGIEKNASVQFRIRATGTIKVDGRHPYHVQGKLELGTGSKLDISPFGPAVQTVIDSTISGAGTIELSSYRGAKAEKTNQGHIELTGTNVAYTGQIFVSHDYYHNEDPGEETYDIPHFGVHVWLYAHDGRNLGGPLESFDFDSLWLRHWGCLKPQQSITLDQANRGVYCSDKALLNLTDDVTMTILNPLTLNGTLLAYGGGTLALGGQLRFADNDDLADLGSPDPIAAPTNNILIASNVCVRALSTNAFDGAALTLKGASPILVDPTATGDVAAYGLVNLRGTIAADDLDAETETDTIRVELDGTAGLDAAAYDIAICTVPADSSLTTTSFALQNRPKGYAATIVSEATAAGKTFKVRLVRTGFQLFFR